jgi:hypothetical protein
MAVGSGPGFELHAHGSPWSIGASQTNQSRKPRAAETDLALAAGCYKAMRSSPVKGRFGRPPGLPRGAGPRGFLAP